MHDYYEDALGLGPKRPPVEARTLLARISSWPSVRVDRRGDDAAVYSGVRNTRIARLNLRTGLLTAFVDADTGCAITAADPRLRLTPDGVRLNVSTTDSCMRGERLMRWRLDLERFDAQLREASP
jgi:hypothetical protein